MTCIDDRYDIGDRPTLIATFVDAAGDPADPTAITFSLLAPDGTVTTGNEGDATNPTVGEWRWPSPVVLDAAGTWAFRAQATAGLETADEVTFEVVASLFA